MCAEITNDQNGKINKSGCCDGKAEMMKNCCPESMGGSDCIAKMKEMKDKFCGQKNDDKGGTMSFESAQQFVTKMRENHEFRNEASKIPDTASMEVFIKTNDFDFDISHLVEAMADCMDGIERAMNE